MLETKETQKVDHHKQKVMQEKQLRDRQMQEEKRRKKDDERQQRAMDDRTVKSLQEELTSEQRAAEQRRTAREWAHAQSQARRVLGRRYPVGRHQGCDRESRAHH